MKDDIGNIPGYPESPIGQGKSADILAAAHEWAADVARALPSGDEIEMAERYRDADDDSMATLIHGQEELMLAYADQLAGNDPIWSLMRQQYQAMLEL